MKKFTKKDLKSGMIVEYRNGERGVVLDDKIIGEEGFNYLHSYTEELKEEPRPDTGWSSYDIKKVYTSRASFIDDIFKDKCLELIWEREEVQFMTAAQMAAKLEELTGKRTEVEHSREEMYGALMLHCHGTACSKCIFNDECFKSHSTIEELKPLYEKLMRGRND